MHSPASTLALRGRFLAVALSLAPLGAGGSAASLIGCSSSSSGTTYPVDASTTGNGTDSGVDASLSASLACADSAHARCTRNDVCTAGLANKSRYGDEATCEARLALSCEANLAAPGTGATTPSVEACSAALISEACAQYLGNSPPAECIPQVGTLALGAACGAPAQCQSTYCAIPANAACGVCATVPKAGDTCASTAECGARGGLRCVSLVCVVEGALAATCSKDQPCGPDLSCVTPAGAASGTCQAAVASAGAACDPKKETGPGCDSDLGLYCDGQSHCAAYTYATDGQLCGVPQGGGVIACIAGTCILPQVAVDAGPDGGDAGTKAGLSGTCKSNAKDGQPCDTDVGPACELPARCVVAGSGTSGTCVLPDPSTCK